MKKIRNEDKEEKKGKSGNVPPGTASATFIPHENRGGRHVMQKWEKRVFFVRKAQRVDAELGDALQSRGRV